jgi:hypothetical protein
MVNVKQVLSTVVVTYAIAIGLTLALGILSIALKEAFGEFGDPFVDTYNSVRNLTLFIMVFPLALSFIVLGFFGDIAIGFLIPVINGIFPDLNLPTTIGGKTLMQIVSAPSTGIIDQIINLINTVFPKLEK